MKQKSDGNFQHLPPCRGDDTNVIFALLPCPFYPNSLTLHNVRFNLLFIPLIPIPLMSRVLMRRVRMERGNSAQSLFHLLHELWHRPTVGSRTSNKHNRSFAQVEGPRNIFPRCLTAVNGGSKCRDKTCACSVSNNGEFVDSFLC